MRSPKSSGGPTSQAWCNGGPCQVGVQPAAASALETLFPAGGPADGGTDVRLQGEGLEHDFSRLMRCKFGGVQTFAHMVQEQDAAAAAGSLIRCRSPIRSVAGPVDVQFSATGGHSWVAGAPAFFFYDPPSVRALRPDSGPIAGGTIVLVLGAGFGPYTELGKSVALCRFGSAASAAPRHRGGADGAETGVALQPVGPALQDAPLRTHVPHFVTTPGSILHQVEPHPLLSPLPSPPLTSHPLSLLYQGALRCRAPAARSLGEYAVEVSLNGVDFSPSGSTPVAFRFYDNWMRPHIGGAAPSSRGAHAAARLGNSLWVFGGWGERRSATGGWAEVRGEMKSADGNERDIDRLHAYHNDMHELKTAMAIRHYPSQAQPDLVWFPIRYRSYDLQSAANASAAADEARTANEAATEAAAAAAAAAADGGVQSSLPPTSNVSSTIASPQDASSPYVLTPKGAPRARSGHTLTAVGVVLVLFGGVSATGFQPAPFATACRRARVRTPYLAGSHRSHRVPALRALCSAGPTL